MDVTILYTVERLALAMVIGGVIGIDRQVKKRSAGFKTYSMVCVGATLVMLTGQFIFHQYQVGDVARLGAQVISGIGFLGVGTIVTSTNNKVNGLTTAAGLWTTACIGLAIGIGYTSGAIAAGVTVLLLLKVLKYVDDGIRKRIHYADLYIELFDVKAISEVSQKIDSFQGVSIVFLDSTPPKVKNSQIGLNVILKLKKELRSADVIKLINQIDTVSFVHTSYP